jgi:hypothetical protein
MGPSVSQGRTAAITRQSPGLYSAFLKCCRKGGVPGHTEKGGSFCCVLTDDQASCRLAKMHAPTGQRLPAKLVPSAETSRAPCQTWLSSPNRGARPHTHGISLLTSALLSPPRTVQHAAIRTCDGDHLGTQVSVARTAAITRQALGLYSAFLKSVCLKMPPGIGRSGGSFCRSDQQVTQGALRLPCRPT